MRRRQRRNLLATLFLSQGVPMLQAGDEFGRTQGGNNNAYCQDNPISWVDWHLRTANAELLQFVQLLAQLHRQHGEFRRETFFKGTPLRGGAKDVSWMHARGTEMQHGDWMDGNLRTIGMWFGRGSSPIGRLLLLLNADHQDQPFRLPPPPPGVPWILQFDTSEDPAGVRSLGPADHYPLQARSVALLEC